MRNAFPPIQPSEDLTDVQAVMIEALLTFNLIFVAASVSDITNKPAVYHGLPALSTAFCIGVGILAAVSTVTHLGQGGD